MTRAQFHTYFKIVMDKNSQSVAFGGCPAFLPEEIDYWLDTALYQVVMQKFNGEINKKPSFEESVKRIHDLEGLVRTDSDITTEKVVNTNSVVMKNLLDNNKRMLFVSARLKYADKLAIVRIIDHKDVERYRQTYNNLPWVEEPVGVIENNSLIIYYDPLSMTSEEGYKIDLTYLHYPTKIEDIPNGESIIELPEHVYHEVINRAALLALEDIESKRTQSKVALNQLAE